MNKYTSNTYEKRNLYNDILTNNSSNNIPKNIKNSITKPVDQKPVDAKFQKNAVVNFANPSSINSNTKNNNTETQNQKFKSEEIKEDKSQDQLKNDSKNQNPKILRIKLDEKSLFYGENGLKTFYDSIAKTSFKENRSEVRASYIIIFMSTAK